MSEISGERSPAGLEHLKAGGSEVARKNCQAAKTASRPCRCVIERAGDVAHADDADQAVIVDHGQMPDVVLVHQMAHMLERVGGAAGHQLLHRDQLRDLEVDASRAVLGDGAHHVALGEHADRGVAFGADHVLDHQRADIVGAHQLRGNGNGFVHANRGNTRGLLAQDVSDSHRNLLLVAALNINVATQCWYTLCQLST